MGVFDEIAIGNVSSPQLRIVRRGPLERGGFDGLTGTWVPDGGGILELVDVDGFGVSNGRPYYDTDLASVPRVEQAGLFLDSATPALWVQ